MKMPEMEKSANINQATVNFNTSSDDLGVIIFDNRSALKGKESPETMKSVTDRQLHQQQQQLNNKQPSDCNKSTDNAKCDNNKNSRDLINIQNFINITKTTTNGNNNQCNVRKTVPTVTTAPSQSWCSSKKASPTSSIRSTTISITSTDENAADSSSVVDSDSDLDEGAPSQYIVKKLGQQTTYAPNSRDIPVVGKGMTVLSQQISPNTAPGSIPLPDNLLKDVGSLCKATSAAPQIGSIALSNSTDVTFGDKHFYEGPVTIQQFLIDSREKRKATDGHRTGAEGQDNPMFSHCDEFKKTATDSDPSQGPNVPSKYLLFPYGLKLNRKAGIITAIIALLILLIGILILTTNSLFKSAAHPSKKLGDGDDSRKNIPIHSNIAMVNIGAGKVLRIVPRDAWLAQPPSSEPIALHHPIHRVVIIPTQTDVCETQAECTYRVRFIQTYNIESTQYDDIIYNFLIGGDGNVYEGRGWDYVGAHLKGNNDNSISIAFIGTFRRNQPSSKQMNVTDLLLKEGVRQRKLDPDYRIIGANKLEPTLIATSGDALYGSFKDWPHWSEL